MTNPSHYNESEIDKSLIFALIFLGLIIYGIYVFLQFFIPVGLIGIIIPAIGFYFHINNAFKNGFEFNAFSLKIDTTKSFFEYITFNIAFSSMFGLLIFAITNHFS